MEDFRKFGPCIVCVNIHHDERDKTIHGLNLCEKHYKAHCRRQQKSNGDAEAGVITDRHISKEMRIARAARVGRG
jgi:hypothetical protein